MTAAGRIKASAVLHELHIAPGTSAAGCMRQAFGFAPPTLLVNQDSLSSGPLPAPGPLDEWRQVRERYLRNLCPEWPEFSFDGEHDLLANTAALRDAERIVLWVGTGLDEQLLVAWLVQLLRAVNVAPSRLCVIQFHLDAKGNETVALGVLSPTQIAAHPPAMPLTGEAIAELDAAWCAVTASDPAALVEFVAGDVGPLPFLRRALAGLLSRFPDLQTGLSRWDRLILECVRDHGPRTAYVIGNVMAHAMEHPDWPGDGYLFARLRHLADPALPQPFLALTGLRSSIRGSEVTLTAVGARALAGEASFVALNGIDEWIGGTHLASAQGRVWFRCGGSLIKAEA